MEKSSARIAGGTPRVKDTTLPHEALKQYRALTREDKEALSVIATDVDVDLLERLLDAEESDEPEQAFAGVKPVVITLTPRLSIALRWQAAMLGHTAE